MKFLRLILIMFAIGFSSAGNAIQFMGVPSCEEWVNRHSTKDKAAIEEWLLGFLSGLAAGQNKEILKNAQKDYLFLWMDNYCQAYPSGRLDNGGYALTIQLTN
jgi:hypothetical protein